MSLIFNILLSMLQKVNHIPLCIIIRIDPSLLAKRPGNADADPSNLATMILLPISAISSALVRPTSLGSL